MPYCRSACGLLGTLRPGCFEHMRKPARRAVMFFLALAGVLINVLIFVILGEHGHSHAGHDHGHGHSHGAHDHGHGHGAHAHSHGGNGGAAHAHAPHAHAGNDRGGRGGHGHAHGGGGCGDGHAHGAEARAHTRLCALDVLAPRPHAGRSGHGFVCDGKWVLGQPECAAGGQQPCAGHDLGR